MNFSPPVSGFKMTYGVQMSVLGDEVFTRRLHLSSLIETEWLNFAFGLGLGELGLQVSTAIDSLTMGIGFKMVDFESGDQWGGTGSNNVMFDLGLRF